MSNIITVTFTPCEPSPAFGYNIMYRPVGSGITYRDGGNYSTSPAIIEDMMDDPGTKYEGFISSDCGDGNFGTEVPFTTP